MRLPPPDHDCRLLALPVLPPRFGITAVVVVTETGAVVMAFVPVAVVVTVFAVFYR